MRYAVWHPDGLLLPDVGEEVAKTRWRQVWAGPLDFRLDLPPGTDARRRILDYLFQRWNMDRPSREVRPMAIGDVVVFSNGDEDGEGETKREAWLVGWLSWERVVLGEEGRVFRAEDFRRAAEVLREIGEAESAKRVDEVRRVYLSE